MTAALSLNISKTGRGTEQHPIGFVGYQADGTSVVDFQKGLLKCQLMIKGKHTWFPLDVMSLQSMVSVATVTGVN